MKWINIEEQLPPDNNETWGETYIVTIFCKSWEEKTKTMIMDWETKQVRNKFVRRWKYNNQIKSDGWIVTHWMELPEPAICKDCLSCSNAFSTEDDKLHCNLHDKWVNKDDYCEDYI